MGVDDYQKATAIDRDSKIYMYPGPWLLLYQAYGCKERKKHRVTNQTTRRQVKNSATVWTLTKRREKKLDGNYTRMLRAILNKSWRQHPTRHQLYGHLPPITKTIQVRRTRHAGHCWRSRDELISDVLLWTPTHGRVKVGRLARTSIQQLCEDTGCCPEDLPEAMNDREKWRERVGGYPCYQHDMMMMMINIKKRNKLFK